MGEIIAIALIVIIVCGAGLYIYKAKKRGAKCIGCPYSGSCRLRNCPSKQNAENEDSPCCYHSDKKDN